MERRESKTPPQPPRSLKQPRDSLQQSGRRGKDRSRGRGNPSPFPPRVILNTQKQDKVTMLKAKSQSQRGRENNNKSTRKPKCNGNKRDHLPPIPAGLAATFVQLRARVGALARGFGERSRAFLPLTRPARICHVQPPVPKQPTRPEWICAQIPWSCWLGSSRTALMGSPTWQLPVLRFAFNPQLPASRENPALIRPIS